MEQEEKAVGRLRNMTAIYLRCGGGMLLLYRMGSRVIGDSYTGTAGGHFEQDELNDPKTCVLRELYEETGLQEQDMENLALRYVALRLKNGEIRQNYYFFADLSAEIQAKWGLGQENVYGEEALVRKESEETSGNQKLPQSTEGRLEWFPNERILDLKMPVSAKYMMEHYLTVGKDTDCVYGGVTTETGVEFVELKEFSDR